MKKKVIPFNNNKIGYARISTPDQCFDLQVDALNQAGCKKIYKDIASGAKAERPMFNDMIANLRPNEVVVVWKLDRLGRSLKHLVEVTNKLMTMNVGLISLNDPIDTTSAQGRLIFNIFASLAEFERDLIRERTMAGLKAARARGRLGGRPKGLSQKAEQTSYAAEALYKNKNLSINDICKKLNVTKPTLYRYLRHRGVKIKG